LSELPVTNIVPSALKAPQRTWLLGGPTGVGAPTALDARKAHTTKGFVTSSIQQLQSIGNEGMMNLQYKE
jgi:hypothetical protein